MKAMLHFDASFKQHEQASFTSKNGIFLIE